MIQPDALNANYADFQGPMMVSFEQNTPVQEELKKRGKKTKGTGPIMERNITTAPPMTMTGIFAGDEVADGTLTQSMGKFRVEPHRAFGKLFIPQKMLLTNTGKTAILNILKDYPLLSMMGIKRDKEKYLLTGKSAGKVLTTAQMLGWSTLNGLFTAGRNTGTTNGLLDFVAPASQTDVCQDVAKSFANENYNQYGDITDKTQLRYVWGKVYRACQNASGNGDEGGPQLLICDDDTFANFEEGQGNLLKIVNIGDGVDQKKASILPYKNALVRSSPAIDLVADFSGAALDGVTYFLDFDWIEVESWEDMTTTPFVKDTVSGQDGMVSLASWMDVNIFFRRFTAQGCTSGGAA